MEPVELKKCRKCKTMLPETSRLCENCGLDNPTLTLINKPLPDTVSGIIGIIFIIGIIIGIVFFVRYLSSSNKSSFSKASSPNKSINPDSGVRGTGWLYAKSYIKPVLKSPQSAKFPWDTVSFTREDPFTTENGEKAKIWIVYGAVDAQNSFGAKLRYWWEVTIVFWDSSDNMYCYGVKLDGKIVYSPLSLK